ncbi:MAG: hypothetical protein JXR65_03355, partial [Bacteroidales bacterium]|nr:hypothetical protein [Bacteroidales bacterium]
NISRNLSKIAELRVVAIYQTENTNLEKIKNHLNVEYILDGTIHQKSRNDQLILKLINSRNNRLEWSESFTLFDQDNFPTESEITLAIARELNIDVKEEERLLIGKRLTINPNANDFYEMGRYAHLEYLLNNVKKDALEKAEYYYKKSLLHDPNFAESYAGLARVAYDRTTWSDVFKLTYLDTVMSLANKALSLDSTLADAYIIRGDYYREKIPSQAVCEYEQALRYDPNNWQAYSGLARYYLVRDNIKSVEYFFESAKRYRGPEYELVLNWLAFQFRIYGLFEQAEYFNKLKLEWDNDSIQYYLGMAAIEHYQEHYEKANEFALKAYATDSNDININGLLGFNFILLKDYKNAIYHYQKTLDLTATMNYKQNNEHHRLGYVYLLRGNISKANEYFNLQIRACDTLLSRNNQDIPAQYDLAATYSILGQKDKAYENLRMFNKEESIQWFLYFYMKNDPLLETIRNEPEFQQILKEVKQKATATRDKLKTWVDQQKNI